MKILIADSGSTSTNWALVSTHKCLKKCNMSGLNPYYRSQEEIIALLQKELLPYFSEQIRKEISAIYFYGAGCSTTEKKEIVSRCLQIISPNATIFTDHDLTAAAKSCCGEGKGIGCILGTGSNSCVYNGNSVQKSAISLGYFLGDEGSGTHIGKLFVTELLKNRLPETMEKLFFEQFHFTKEEILDHIYHQEKPNLFIGQFTPFVSTHLNEFEELGHIVKNAFKDFIREFIQIFPESYTYPINFVGSVAYFFQDTLKETFIGEGFPNVGNIVRYPIDGLVAYHQKQMIQHIKKQ